MSKLHRSISKSLLMVVLSSAAAAPAFATSSGIVGFSGKTGLFCSSCHTGGAVPDVVFEAPDGTELAAGTVATFRFRITSARNQQSRAGFNVAASAGTLAVAEAGTRSQIFQGLPELTHTTPRQNDANRDAVFAFTWTAPAAPGTYTLFGAGNSVNGNGLQTGDRSDTTTLGINVVAGASPTPSPIPTATVTATMLPTQTPTATVTASFTPTPRATPSATHSPVPTDTATPIATTTGAQTQTATATATATASAAGRCDGDCDGNGIVTVDEIVRGVNIALGTQATELCAALDRDGSGTVTVDELVRAIQNALRGC
jgi:hypothetical protein